MLISVINKAEYRILSAELKDMLAQLDASFNLNVCIIRALSRGTQRRFSPKCFKTLL